MENNLKKQAEKILQTVKEYGTEQNFFFATTFEKYLTQLEILEKIKADLVNDDPENTKAMMYNKVVDSSNKTLGSLIRLITTMRNEKERRERDPLLETLNGKNKKNE